MQKTTILLLDNYDSFTYNLVDYLEQLGISSAVIRNTETLQEIQKGNYSGVLLSPGPESPEKAGNLMEVLQYYAHRLPILGVCLGHQAIGMHFGWKLDKAKRPMHGKLSSITHDGEGMFSKLPENIEVVRYHSLIVTPPVTPSPLQAQAYTAEGEIMAMQHQTLPIWGMQFHPEAALTQFGLEMLRNWTKML